MRPIAPRFLSLTKLQLPLTLGLGLLAPGCVIQGGGSSPDPGIDTAAGRTSSGSTSTGPTDSNSSGLDTSSQTPDLKPAWAPAPCPAGWVRPVEGSFEAHVLRVDGQTADGSFEFHRSYPKAHAFGTCMRVHNEKIAEVQIEFGPEVQGMPQSLLKLKIDHGEIQYEIRSEKKYGEPKEPVAMTMHYTHAFADPSTGSPKLKTWTAGAAGPDLLEYHALTARWVSATAGHYLIMDNKTIVEALNPDKADPSFLPLDLGFRLKLRVPGGPATPTPEFCATLNTQDRCDLLSCGHLNTVAEVTEPKTCGQTATAICLLDEHTELIDLPDNESRTYYDPQQSHRFTTAYREPFEEDPIRVPKGWVACTEGATTPLACDCSCAHAGCRSERLREELTRCKLARPCQDVVSSYPDNDTKQWNENQICVLERMRDRVPGSYRIALNLGDPDYDIQMHVAKDGSITQAIGHCDHANLGGCKNRSWSYPASCKLADPSYFTECLTNPNSKCFDRDPMTKSGQPWFLECARIEAVDCSK